MWNRLLGECHKEMRLPFSVQIFLVSVVAGERFYLLLQRNARPELGLPDFWQGFSGALEPGESFADASIREVFEESGIALGSVCETGFRQYFPVRSEWRNSYGPEPKEVEEHIFYALVHHRIEPTLSAEHKSWRWCNVQEALKLLTFGANAECLQVVDDILSAAEA
jgi:8-oxo-dGTP pyrophosphatase MutT (NUDIX family)